MTQWRYAEDFEDLDVDMEEIEADTFESNFDDSDWYMQTVGYTHYSR